MPHIDLDILIDSYEDKYFLLAKRRFAKYGKEISKLYGDKSIDTLLYVICSPNVIESVSNVQFSKMVKSLFYEKLHDQKFLLKLMTAMYSLIAETKSLKYEGRAKRYYENLSSGYLDKIKDKNSDFQIKNANEVQEFVIDYLKKILMLYGRVLVSDGKAVISEVDNASSEIILEKFAQSYFNFVLPEDDEEESTEETDENQHEVKAAYKKKDNVFGKIGHGIQKGIGQAVDSVSEMNAKSKNKKEQGSQTKHLYRLVTWFLFYRLCQDEAYIPEE